MNSVQNSGGMNALQNALNSLGTQAQSPATRASEPRMYTAGTDANAAQAQTGGQGALVTKMMDALKQIMTAMQSLMSGGAGGTSGQQTPAGGSDAAGGTQAGGGQQPAGGTGASPSPSSQAPSAGSGQQATGADGKTGNDDPLQQLVAKLQALISAITGKPADSTSTNSTTQAGDGAAAGTTGAGAGTGTSPSPLSLVTSNDGAGTAAIQSGNSADGKTSFIAMAGMARSVGSDNNGGSATTQAQAA